MHKRLRKNNIRKVVKSAKTTNKETRENSQSEDSDGQPDLQVKKPVKKQYLKFIGTKNGEKEEKKTPDTSQSEESDSQSDTRVKKPVKKNYLKNYIPKYQKLEKIEKNENSQCEGSQLKVKKSVKKQNSNSERKKHPGASEYHSNNELETINTNPHSINGELSCFTNGSKKSVGNTNSKGYTSVFITKISQRDQQNQSQEILDRSSSISCNNDMPYDTDSPRPHIFPEKVFNSNHHNPSQKILKDSLGMDYTNSTAYDSDSPQPPCSSPKVCNLDQHNPSEEILKDSLGMDYTNFTAYDSDSPQPPGSSPKVFHSDQHNPSQEILEDSLGTDYTNPTTYDSDSPQLPISSPNVFYSDQCNPSQTVLGDLPGINEINDGTRDPNFFRPSVSLPKVFISDQHNPSTEVLQRAYSHVYQQKSEKVNRKSSVTDNSGHPTSQKENPTEYYGTKHHNSQNCSSTVEGNNGVESLIDQKTKRDQRNFYDERNKFLREYYESTTNTNKNAEHSLGIYEHQPPLPSMQTMTKPLANTNDASLKTRTEVSIGSIEINSVNTNVSSEEKGTANNVPIKLSISELLTGLPNCPSLEYLNENKQSFSKFPQTLQQNLKSSINGFQPDKCEDQGISSVKLPGHDSDEDYYDTLDDIPPLNNSTSNIISSNVVINGNLVKKKNAKWWEISKQNAANILKPAKNKIPPANNMLFCSDKKQYIKKKCKKETSYYNAKFLFHHSYLVSQGEVSYEILGKRNLLIADSDNFIARIKIAPGEELNFSKSFRTNKKILVDRITITKVLEDDLLVQRNETYKLFKKILEARSENISDFLECTDDIFQISIMLKTYHFYRERPQMLLNEFTKNNFISSELKAATDHLLKYETNLQKRNQLFPKFTCPTYFTLDDLFAQLQGIRMKSVKVHKDNLIKKCSTQNSYFLCRILDINKLSDEKLLRITNEDIKLFTDLMTLTNDQSSSATFTIPIEFIDNLWSSFFAKLKSKQCKSIKDSGPLTHPIYFFLVKSLRDLIRDISTRSNTSAAELFKKDRTEFVVAREIFWPLNSPINQSLDKQYYLIYKLMKHFEPGTYINTKKFEYTFDLLRDTEDLEFWQTIRNLVIRNRNDLLNLPDERLIWLYIVDAGIAPIFRGETNERFEKLSSSLLKGFVKFIQNAKHIRYESFRIAAHNIVKFAAQISPYFTEINSVTQNLDHSILDKQMDFINCILTSDENDLTSNLFSSLMEVYNEYWDLRESVVGKLPVPCSIFSGLMDEIAIKILEIVDKTLLKQVELQLIVQYFRLFNEFLKHFKGINFAWFISKNAYCPDLAGVVEELKKEEKTTYKVTDPEKLVEILTEKDVEVPRHFLIETVLELLKIINMSLDKSNWRDEDCLKAEGDLFLAIGHSFTHFEDQTDYTDIEHFLRDCTTPFHSVTKNSLTYSDFKTRLDNVENYYLYARKQNQIGIQLALDLCEKEVIKANENGFSTSINKKILEECFNRYAEKLALLENLKIPEILEDMAEELKKVDVLPFERWTSHFKQTVLPVLLAELAAIWTIQESKDLADIKKRIEPHCIQIICILRLIGADFPENGVPKHFAQVLTGQGKSIILGLLSGLIALTGHKANIVCYSRYLAIRDQTEFDSFFKTFDRFTGANRPSYYTFDNMAEDFLSRKINGEKVYLRSVVNDLVLNKLETKEIESVENPTDSVLLIDEADVFFSDNFYGQTYNPCSTIGMPALLEIQPKLWEIVEGGIYDENVVLEKIREFVNELLKDETYEDFKNFISSTNTLFEESLNKMVATAIKVSRDKKNIDNWFIQKYKIDYNGHICFRERLGSYCSSTYMGYFNVFNYFRLKKNNYDDKCFKNYGYFFVIWGYVSYANLPLSYKNILGVSGTLMTLNDSEKKAIKRYGIDTMSAMSSFFGERKLFFKPNEHFTIQDTVNDWLSKIFDHVSSVIKANRAVLVFFDTDVEARAFEEKYRNSINRLFMLIGSEEPDVVEWRINEAGVAQTVTLATRAMGRGIDYKSNDHSVEDNGGIHVIQTFFSFDKKEETQLMGRTARKDNKGSYELILCRDHLKELECNEKSDGKPVTTYQELCDVRLIKANSNGLGIEAKIKDSEKEHNLTMAFLKSLTKYTPEERGKYFSKYPFVKPD